ncbi:MAG: glycosyltransferase [Bacteroidales bacterium]|nr:glycosyltransferase [Bacteroidales bacterium]
MNIRLSIIIPFYNVEPYIARCLDSVYQQDIPEEDYEVICVNDGSPDHSRDIVLEYQKKHPNLILVEHEVNKKLGAARNTGRKIARGKYIWNVDSDDMIAPNCLGEILEMCEKNCLDVFLFGFTMLRNNTMQEENVCWAENKDAFSGITFWKQQGLQNLGKISQVWTQVYRREYLDDNGVFSPEINMGEDIPYTCKSILLSQRMKVCNIPYYICRDNSESLTRTLNKIPKPQTVYENSFVCGKYMNDISGIIPVEEKSIRESVRAIEQYVIIQYQKYVRLMSDNDVRELRMLCRKHFFNNSFVLTSLGKKKALEYIRFVFFGFKEFKECQRAS